MNHYNLFSSNNGLTPHYLVESNKVLFETYRPILAALQDMDLATIPFTKYICPSTLPTEDVVVDAPLYTKSPVFRFNLNAIAAKGAPDILLNVNDAGSIRQCRQLIQTHSTLDARQSDALIGALTSECTYIQGPPGTGKLTICNNKENRLLPCKLFERYSLLRLKRILVQFLFFVTRITL